MEKFGGEVGQKYAKIDRAGRKTVDEGTIVEHTVWPENLKERFNVAALFDDPSGKEFKLRVVDKIRDIEKKLNISVHLALRDFPLHSTVLEGTFEADKVDSAENSAQKRDVIFSQMVNSVKIDELERSIVGSEIVYKYILINGVNILMTATEIPEEIINARGILEEEYRNVGLKPLAMKNILHCTVGRISGLPNDPIEKMRVLGEYKKALIELRHELSGNPIRLKIKSFNRSSAYALLTSKENKI